MTEFTPQTHWVTVSQDAYDRALAGSTSHEDKPVVEKGSNRQLRVCDTFTTNDNCLSCTDALNCPVGKLALRKKSSTINPNSYL